MYKEGNSKWFLGFLIVILLLGVLFYKNWANISQYFQPKAEKNVDKFLTLIQNEHPSEKELLDITQIISPQYTNLISGNSYYQIDNWKIEKNENVGFDSDYTKVFVTGSAINAFGAKLNRKPIFILDEEGQIIDSYNFIAYEKYNSLNKSDMEIFHLLNSLKEEVKIENVSWSLNYSSYLSGLAEGKATVFNDSEVPISYVKMKIIYYDKSKNIVNTDETYAVSSDDLLPGQRRVVEWSTNNCKGAEEASIKLDFK